MTDAPNPPDKDARMWATLCHIAGLVGPLGPLIVWLIKKEEYPIVKEQGREALNFQITVLLACLVTIPLMFVCVGFILFAGVEVASIVFIILAALQANKGVAYRYPVCLRLIK
jgi:uncharacterized Tic20 family protein